MWAKLLNLDLKSKQSPNKNLITTTSKMSSSAEHNEVEETRTAFFYGESMSTSDARILR